MSLKIHPRVAFVREARIAIEAAVMEAVDKQKLTYMELWGVLLDIQTGWAKYGIRDERHPDDPNKPGGLE